MQELITIGTDVDCPSQGGNCDNIVDTSVSLYATSNQPRVEVSKGDHPHLELAAEEMMSGQRDILSLDNSWPSFEERVSCIMDTTVAEYNKDIVGVVMNGENNIPDTSRREEEDDLWDSWGSREQASYAHLSMNHLDNTQAARNSATGSVGINKDDNKWMEDDRDCGSRSYDVRNQEDSLQAKKMKPGTTQDPPTHHYQPQLGASRWVSGRHPES